MDPHAPAGRGQRLGLLKIPEDGLEIQGNDTWGQTGAYRVHQKYGGVRKQGIPFFCAGRPEDLRLLCRRHPEQTGSLFPENAARLDSPMAVSLGLDDSQNLAAGSQRFPHLANILAEGIEIYDSSGLPGRGKDLRRFDVGECAPGSAHGQKFTPSSAVYPPTGWGDTLS